MIFPEAEFARRTQALQKAMAHQELDALLLTTAADIFYTTGFLTRFWESPARPWYVLVPSGGKPVAIIPSIGAALMHQTWIDDVRTWDAPNPDDDGISLLAQSLGDLVSETGRIAVPMGHETHLRMPLGDYQRLQNLLEPRQFADGTDVIQGAREIKSDAEVDVIRGVCNIASAAFDQVPGIVAKTGKLDAVFRDFQAALLSERADWVSYLAGGAGQGGYDDVISPAGPRPLASGDVLMLDTGAVRNGYFCDFDRNFAIGALAEDTARAHAALWMATEAALEALRPGMTCREVHALMVNVLTEEGATPASGRFGHGLGINLTEWPSIAANDARNLKAGMVLTLEPSAVLSSGRMLVHEENIVLRETGAELLSRRAPEQMPVIVP